MKKAIFLGLVPTIMLVVAGCSTLSEDPSGISIRHAAGKSLTVENRANEHCQAFGKQAVKTMTSPVETTYLVQTEVSTFACR